MGLFSLASRLKRKCHPAQLDDRDYGIAETKERNSVGSFGSDGFTFRRIAKFGDRIL